MVKKQSVNKSYLYDLDSTKIDELLDKININPEHYAKSIPIDELVAILKYLSDAYYNTGNTLISDINYDILKDALEERDPTNKFLTEIGAPIKVEKEQVKLPYSMGSLTKVKPEKNNLDGWLKTYQGPYVLSDKLDGISAQFWKKSDNEYKMYTRGDGDVGADISSMIPFLISKTIKLNDIPIGTSIRGEIIMSKKNFETIAADNKNPRNTVGGIVNSKTLDETFVKMVKLCDFVTYAIINPRYKQDQQFKLLKNYGFLVAEYKIVKEINYDFLSDYLKKRREDSNYEVDGIVVADDGEVYPHTSGNPDYAFAYKTILADQVAIATIVKVIWNVSMDAYLKPTIEIKPINLVGTTITYATAFNAQFVEENKLGPGAKVKLVRSGDVIPYIMEVVEPAKTAQMPEYPYVWTPSHVDIILQDIHGAMGDIITVKKLEHFFKKIGAKFISEGILTKLVAAGYKTLKDILMADKSKLAQIDGIGKKLVDKIFKSVIDALNNSDLATLMAASHIFGRGLGEKKIYEITAIYPNILNEKWTKKQFLTNILAINGFSDLTAGRFVDNFAEFKEYLKELNNIDIDDLDLSDLLKEKGNNEEENNEDNDGEIKEGNKIDLTGKIFVFTGFRDKDLEKQIIKSHGKVSTSISSKTSYVVKADENTEKKGKIIEAEKLNIPVITKDELINLLS